MKNRLVRLLNRVAKIFSLITWANTFEVIKGNKIIAYWWRGRDNKNWGDKINIYLIESLSNKKVVHAEDVFNFRFLKVYSCVGSIVEHLRFKNVHIWGSGIIKSDSYLPINPSAIHAVRGPQTRKRLIEAGYDCPEVYGDPALLMPVLYKPEIKKTKRLGIIPHFVDKQNPVVQQFVEDDVLIIDIFADDLEFIDQVNKCHYVVSSSMHGLIIADSYEIPSKWIKITDRVYGGNFKYIDYYESIGVYNEQPLILKNGVTKEDIIKHCWKKDMNNDLNMLLNSCPFLEKKISKE